MWVSSSLTYAAHSWVIVKLTCFTGTVAGFVLVYPSLHCVVWLYACFSLNRTFAIVTVWFFMVD